MSNLSTKLKTVTTQPGCYIYKDAGGNILYIGKAKNLKKRVSSYFQKEHSDLKTRALVPQISDFEVIVTDTEVEALLLEARLIRRHQPKFNMELKSTIRYAYIKITNEAFPRLETVREVKKGEEVYGPYTSGAARQQLIRLANYLFRLRSSKKKPIRMGKSSDVYQIRCSTVPWNREVTEEEYAQDIERARFLLKGEVKELRVQLANEMQQYSKEKKFELAKLRRDQIDALDRSQEQQKVQLTKAYDQDVINFIEGEDVAVQVFQITKGVITGRKEFHFSLETFDLSDFVQQYYFDAVIPQEVIVPFELEDSDALEQYLSRLSERKVTLVVPQRGTKKQLLELVKKNIVVSVTAGDSGLFELQEKLSLPTLPAHIECFDISNLGNEFIVGSMVHFANGKPDKNNYRRFKIKWQRGQSDFDAMREVVFRRYYRITKERSALPDLIMVDGGKPQLTAARQALKELGVQTPLVALAKKEEELFLPKRTYSIRLSKRSDALKLVQRIRDEAHRFAITYNRFLRTKNISK